MVEGYPEWMAVSFDRFFHIFFGNERRVDSLVEINVSGCVPAGRHEQPTVNRRGRRDELFVFSPQAVPGLSLHASHLLAFPKIPVEICHVLCFMHAIGIFEIVDVITSL